MWQPGPVTPTRLLAGTLGAGATLGAAVTAYAVWEARAYTLRSVELPLLPAGARPLRVLHLSDLHLTPGQSRKREWLRSLADLEPDLVINTGDSLAHVDALPPLLDALGPLLDVPGAFVLGSNDYFAPILRNPFWYLLPDDGTRVVHTTKLPWQDLVAAFSTAGWLDLTNRRTTSTVGDLTVAWAGVDDPHLTYDDLGAVSRAGRRRRRPAPRGRTRAVPTGARPVRGRRLRRDLRRSHPRRSDRSPAVGRTGHQLRPRAGPGQGPASSSGRLATGGRGIVVAARLRRAGHLAVLPDPHGLPPRGDAPDV